MKWKIIIMLIMIQGVYAMEANTSNYQIDINQVDSSGENITTTNYIIQFHPNKYIFEGSFSVPTLTLEEPKNKTYYVNTLTLRYTSNGNTVYYNVDDSENITLDGDVQFTTSLGSHILKLFAEDTQNNIVEENVSFTIEQEAGESGSGIVLAKEPEEKVEKEFKFELEEGFFSKYKYYLIFIPLILLSSFIIIRRKRKREEEEHE